MARQDHAGMLAVETSPSLYGKQISLYWQAMHGFWRETCHSCCCQCMFLIQERLSP